jgi:RNA polymerase sigma factor (sigma-70 family)
MNSEFFIGKNPDWNKIRARVEQFVTGKVPKAEVDDVVQETVIAISLKIGRFDSKRNVRFSSWFLSFARYKIIDWYRRQGVIRKTLLVLELQQIIDEQPTAANEERCIDRELLRVCIGKVSPKYKIILDLILAHNTTSPTELNRLLRGKNINTTKTNVRRAVDEIRKHYLFALMMH